MQSYTTAPDVLAAHLDREAVLLHMGLKRYFRLNESAACVWRALESGANAEGIAQALGATFDVTPTVAKDAVSTILADLARKQLVVADPAA